MASTHLSDETADAKIITPQTVFPMSQEVTLQPRGAPAPAAMPSRAPPSNNPQRPRALLPVLARVMAHLDKRSREAFQKLTMVPHGEESDAEGAAPGCYFVASLARLAVNETVRTAKVRRRSTKLMPPITLKAACAVNSVDRGYETVVLSLLDSCIASTVVMCLV